MSDELEFARWWDTCEFVEQPRLKNVARAAYQAGQESALADSGVTVHRILLNQQHVQTRVRELEEALENILGEVGTSAYGHPTRVENIYQIARKALTAREART